MVLEETRLSNGWTLVRNDQGPHGFLFRAERQIEGVSLNVFEGRTGYTWDAYIIGRKDKGARVCQGTAPTMSAAMAAVETAVRSAPRSYAAEE